MPIVCKFKPNRSYKRTWTLSDFKRIAKFVCRKYGPGPTERAWKEARCTKELDCEKVMVKVLNVISGMAYVYIAAYWVNELLNVRWVMWILTRNKYGRILLLVLETLRLLIPDLLKAAKDIQALQELLRLRIEQKAPELLPEIPPPDEIPEFLLPEP